MSARFLVGEYVERKFDGAVGIVKRVDEWNGGFAYAVDLGRTPMEGLKDDVWAGTEDAWRHHHRVHAHVSTRSRDCDGEYRSGYTATLTSEERCSQFGDMEFKSRMVASTVSVIAEEGTLDVRPGVIAWYERTDEGFRETAVEWCEDDCADGVAWQRDLSAEAAGY